MQQNLVSQFEPHVLENGSFEELPPAQLAAVEGGVVARYDAQGNMIGCTGRVLTTALNNILQRVLRLQ